MDLKSSQIALAGAIIRFVDQLILTPSHFLTASSKDKWLLWSNNLESSILTTAVIALIFVMMCADKTKVAGAVAGILFGIWFIASGLLGVGLSAILFLLAYPLQFAATFTPPILLIAAGWKYLNKENTETAKRITELKSEIF